MNFKKSHFVLRIPAFIAVLLLLGCATSPSQINDANIKKEIVSSDHLTISNVSIDAINDGFSIDGYMRHKYVSDSLIRGHIDIEVVDTAGTVLHRTKTSILHRTKTSTSHRTKTSISHFGRTRPYNNRYRFSVDVPYIPPNGSTVRVIHHVTAQG